MFRSAWWNPLGWGVLCALLAAAAAAEPDPRGSLELARAESPGLQTVVRQGDWAAQLVELLGLEAALPAEASDDDRFSLLCAEQAEAAIAARSGDLARGAFRVASRAPQPRDGEVSAVLVVPAPALYQLSVEGAGLQRWVVDGLPVGHLDLSGLGTAQAPIIVPLRTGPHEVAGYLARGARVDRVELAATRSLCVAPAEGWRPERGLSWGELARTLVRAWDLDRLLPERRAARQEIEAERFAAASGGGGATNRRLSQPASGGSWATAVASPAEFTWEIELAEPSVVSLEARTHGVQAQLWSVDGRYRTTLEPGHTPSGFSWNHVLTLPLAAGRHAVRALVPLGAGVDVLRLRFHPSADARYLDVLAHLGFGVEAPGAPVSRADLGRLRARPAFPELASGFRRRLAGDRRDRTLVLVEPERPRLGTRSFSPTAPAEL